MLNAALTTACVSACCSLVPEAGHDQSQDKDGVVYVLPLWPSFRKSRKYFVHDVGLGRGVWARWHIVSKEASLVTAGIDVDPECHHSCVSPCRPKRMQLGAVVKVKRG